VTIASPISIPFNNLKPYSAELGEAFTLAIQRVLASGWYILGPEVEAFEREFAAYHGMRHAVGVANGTDAIELALRAAGIGAGDEVITVAHTAVATVCAIERAGATPVLVDIEPDTFTLSPDAAATAITPCTKAIVPVHIYGQLADMPALRQLADQHGLLLIEDCAQGHGARLQDRLAGTWGDLATFSFYPTKNLGALGDGGAIVTNDAGYAERLKRLRTYGQTSRYIHAERGMNSRLDEMQAALLRVKLEHLDRHNQERREIAAIYNYQLQNVITPVVSPESYHVYHLYVIRHGARDGLMQALAQEGVGTLIHYPVPVHLQEAYHDLGYPAGSLPHTEQAAREILSLPLYIGLTTAQAESVAAAVNALV
jgi:dTDP-3-amino-3,4,6-trideoxy-alpha-D-glucose transaminase